MAHPKLVFLIGGSDAYEAMAGEFLAAAGGLAARIALLLHDRARCAPYVPHYTEPWVRRGITECQPVFAEPDGTLNLERAREILQWATGIFVGGGDTPIYHRLYASRPVRALIRRRYAQGVPFAGVSAGAMLAMERCFFEPIETPDGTFQVVTGLSLVRDWVIGVHFTASNALPGMLEAMARTRTKRGLGIDDGACAVFDAGRFLGVLGQSVYEVEMHDFQRALYRTARVHLPYSPRS